MEPDFVDATMTTTTEPPNPQVVAALEVAGCRILGRVRDRRFPEVLDVGHFRRLNERRGLPTQRINEALAEIQSAPFTVLATRNNDAFVAVYHHESQVLVDVVSMLRDNTIVETIAVRAPADRSQLAQVGERSTVRGRAVEAVGLRPGETHEVAALLDRHAERVRERSAPRDQLRHAHIRAAMAIFEAIARYRLMDQQALALRCRVARPTLWMLELVLGILVLDLAFYDTRNIGTGLVITACVVCASHLSLRGRTADFALRVHRLRLLRMPFSKASPPSADLLC